MHEPVLHCGAAVSEPCMCGVYFDLVHIDFFF